MHYHFCTVTSGVLEKNLSFLGKKQKNLDKFTKLNARQYTQ